MALSLPGGASICQKGSYANKGKEKDKDEDKNKNKDKDKDNAAKEEQGKKKEEKTEGRPPHPARLRLRPAEFRLRELHGFASKVGLVMHQRNTKSHALMTTSATRSIVGSKARSTP